MPLLSLRRDSPSKIVPDFLCATLQLSRQSNGRSKPEVVGSIPTEVKIFFSLPRVVPCFPLLGLTPSGLFMGLSSTIIYTSELILCSTICVSSATRDNVRDIQGNQNDIQVKLNDILANWSVIECNQSVIQADWSAAFHYN